MHLAADRAVGFVVLQLPVLDLWQVWMVSCSFWPNRWFSVVQGILTPTRVWQRMPSRHSLWPELWVHAVYCRAGNFFENFRPIAKIDSGNIYLIFYKLVIKTQNYIFPKFYPKRKCGNYARKKFLFYSILVGGGQISSICNTCLYEDYAILDCLIESGL